MHNSPPKEPFSSLRLTIASSTEIQALIPEEDDFSISQESEKGKNP